MVFTWPEGKVAKNRQHFDVRPMRDDGELVVLADPEGNEFCVE